MHEPAVAWLSVDEDDNDPARFFAYLAEALRRVEPELGARAAAAIRAPGADLVDVVDDYHLVTNADVHEAVGYLIERSPASFRVVLATREDPPFPLGRLR